MKKELLTAVGVALYGPRWQSDMARELKVSDRVVRRWIAGDGEIPANIEKELIVLCSQNIARLKAAIEQLETSL